MKIGRYGHRPLESKIDRFVSRAARGHLHGITSNQHRLDDFFLGTPLFGVDGPDPFDSDISIELYPVGHYHS